jgi:hypothetical protein
MFTCMHRNAGDMNARGKESKLDQALAGASMLDAWLVQEAQTPNTFLKKDPATAAAYTFDGSVNKAVETKQGKRPWKARYDRVFFKSKHYKVTRAV